MEATKLIELSKLMEPQILSYIFDFLKAIAWPLVTGVIFLYLRKQIKNLFQVIGDFVLSINQRGLEQGIKVTTSGIEIPGVQEAEKIIEEIAPPRYYKNITEQNEAETIVNDDLHENTKDVKKILKNHQPWLLDEVASAIDVFLENPKNSNLSKETALHGLLCDAYISLFFERLYQKILGSQLKLLFRLSFTSNKLISKSDLQNIYKNQPISKTMDMDKWLAFLIESDLIDVTDEYVKITEAGDEFLHYIKKRQYDVNVKLG